MSAKRAGASSSRRGISKNTCCRTKKPRHSTVICVEETSSTRSSWDVIVYGMMSNTVMHVPTVTANLLCPFNSKSILNSIKVLPHLQSICDTTFFSLMSISIWCKLILCMTVFFFTFHVILFLLKCTIHLILCYFSNVKYIWYLGIHRINLFACYRYCLCL